MKTKTLFLILFATMIVTASFAQPFKTILPNSESYFINQNGLIKGIKIETVSIEGNDTVYYNFNSIRTDTSCQGGFSDGLTPDGASWVGERIVIQLDGKNLFFNKNADTIIIDTRAALNDSWKLFSFQNGDWIEGLVSAAGIDTALGITDSIKIISLQLKDSNGNLLTHAINSKSFVLSKSHGLIETPGIYDFPADTLGYNITDKKRLTIGEVYDYEVGDERQIKSVSSDFGPLDVTYNYNVIIGKDYSLGLDSIHYQIKRKIIRYAYYPDSTWHYNLSHPNVISISEDTIQETYTQLNEPVIALMPEESSIKDSDLWDYTLHSKDTIYGGRRFMVYHNYGYYLAIDSCWYQPTDAPFDQTTYIEGLGELHYYGFFSSYKEELIYYRKGQDTFGQLFTAVDEIPRQDYSISIYPNPLTQTATLEYTLTQEETITIRLLDMQGKTIKTFLSNTQREAGSHQQSITLPASLPAGSYLIVIESEKGRMGVRVSKV